MSMLDWENVDVGVNASGMGTAIQEIELHLVTNATKALRDRSELEEALNRAWAGEDRDRFIANLNTSSEDVVAALESYQRQIEQMLQDLVTQWQTFQQSNVN